MSAPLPWRGPGPGRPDGLPVPPAPMPPLLRGRTRKRWRWAGAFGEDVLLCAAYARVGPVKQAWWAVWDRRAHVLHEGSTLGRRGGVRLPAGRVVVPGVVDLAYEATTPVEVVSDHGGRPIWTAKRGGVAFRGTVLGRPADLRGVVDDSAGYHARETAWRWTCGVGTAHDGRAVAWNLVTGVHDDATASERTVWVDGVAHHVAPVAFEPGLTAVTGPGLDLRFEREAVREHEQDLVLFASSYEQPFGTFSGVLPCAGALVSGFGVMERHAVRW